MKVYELFPSRYLSAPEMEGKQVEVTIESVELEKVMTDGRSEEIPVISFAGAKKKMALNKTNAKTISSQHGEDMDKWKGKKITIFPTTCSAFGASKVPCIRVKRGKGGAI